MLVLTAGFIDQRKKKYSIINVKLAVNYKILEKEIIRMLANKKKTITKSEVLRSLKTTLGKKGTDFYDTFFLDDYPADLVHEALSRCRALFKDFY